MGGTARVYRKSQLDGSTYVSLQLCHARGEAGRTVNGEKKNHISRKQHIM